MSTRARNVVRSLVGRKATSDDVRRFWHQMSKFDRSVISGAGPKTVAELDKVLGRPTVAMIDERWKMLGLDSASGYAEAREMLQDLLSPDLISDTAIRIARDHMVHFARKKLATVPVAPIV